MATNTVLTGDISIGRHNTGGAISQFPGMLDEVAVFDKVLSALEIQHLYDAAFVAGGPVPEPATLSLLALGGVCTLRRKRRTA